MKTIRIGLVDDHNLFREGIKSLIDKMPNITLVLEAVNGKDLLIKLNNVIPDVILLDLEMEEMNGEEATIKVKELYPDVKIIILTMHKEDRMISYLMEIGANGYLLKDTSREELENAIKCVSENDNYFNTLVSEALLKNTKNKTRVLHTNLYHKYHLTHREIEVLQLIAQEYTTTEIAKKLFLSVRTIEGHRKNLMDKMDVKNVAGLMIKAVKEQMINV
ncbi:response regulator [Aquimarina rhabdastrellae]